MALKSVPEETIDYIPAYGGNRNDKEEEQMWVRLKPLSRSQADAYRAQIRFKEQRGGFRQQRFETNIRDVQKKQFLDNVTEVHNFLDYKTDKEITDVGEFYAKAPDDLIEEIFDTMLNASQLGEDEIKNFGSQSAGSSRGKTGTAETAKNSTEETDTAQ